MSCARARRGRYDCQTDCRLAHNPRQRPTWRRIERPCAGFVPVALTTGMNLQPGSSIRTGQNGRVLLMRGNETVLISANSAISFPKSSKPNGMSTTILQQAGSILLEVEKRAINHF